MRYADERRGGCGVVGMRAGGRVLQRERSANEALTGPRLQTSVRAQS